MSNVDQLLYDKVMVYANGSLLAEEAQVTFSRNANATNIFTIGIGFAGQSAGPGMCQISITNMVPAASGGNLDNSLFNTASSLITSTPIKPTNASSGMELDATNYLETRNTLQLQIYSGGKQCLVNMYVTDDSLSHAMNSNTNQVINGVGRLPRFN